MDPPQNFLQRTHLFVPSHKVPHAHKKLFPPKFPTGTPTTKTTSHLSINILVNTPEVQLNPTQNINLTELLTQIEHLFPNTQIYFHVNPYLELLVTSAA